MVHILHPENNAKNKLICGMVFSIQVNTPIFSQIFPFLNFFYTELNFFYTKLNNVPNAVLTNVTSLLKYQF